MLGKGAVSVRKELLYTKERNTKPILMIRIGITMRKKQVNTTQRPIRIGICTPMNNGLTIAICCTIICIRATI